MSLLKDMLTAFFTEVPRSKISVVGGIMAAILFPVLLVATILDTQGGIQNPYFSFLIYVVLGPLFILGLILLFLGLFLFKGKEDIGLFAYEYLKEQLTLPGRFTRIRKLIYLTIFLTVFFLVLVGVVSYTGFHYTDSVGFCGQFCHTVMEPEYTTYQNSPHSRVSCVECHIGKGSQWFTKAKFSGIRQLFAVASDSYHRPIKTPIGGLRPTRETCEECHRPEMFHGDKLYIKDKFLPDEHNSHVQTALLMKVGSGGYRGMRAQGIHWHVSENHQVLYTPADEARENISQVMLVDSDGNTAVFNKYPEHEINESDTPASRSSEHPERLMDCMDCHNRPTHIYLDPNEALDQKLITEEIPRQLPYIKRQALEVITRQYASVEEAQKNIASELHEWYRQHYPELAERNGPLLKKAIMGVQSAYKENVFPSMDLEWNTYKNFIGHQNNSGCFRCHDDSHRSKSGRTISKACDTCHIILAEEQPAFDIVRILKGPDIKTGL